MRQKSPALRGSTAICYRMCMAPNMLPPSQSGLSRPLKKDPEQIKRLKAQGLEVPNPDVVWGEDLGPKLEKAGRITTETEENPGSPSKRPQPQTTSDLTAPDPVETTCSRLPIAELCRVWPSPC